MSRQDLNNFIHAAERNAALRKELKDCNDSTKVLDIAAEYGFSITKNDIEQDKEAERINEWFNKSEIKPLKVI